MSDFVSVDHPDFNVDFRLSEWEATELWLALDAHVGARQREHQAWAPKVTNGAV